LEGFVEAGEVEEGEKVEEGLEFVGGEVGDEAAGELGKYIGKAVVPPGAGVEGDEVAMVVLLTFIHE
jgi:hypothetical protein